MISYPGIQISLLIPSVSNEDSVMHTMASAEGMLISMSLQCRDSVYVLWISLTVSFFQLGLSCFGCCERGVVVWWIGAFISAYRGRWSVVLLARFIINDIAGLNLGVITLYRQHYYTLIELIPESA